MPHLLPRSLQVGFVIVSGLVVGCSGTARDITRAELAHDGGVGDSMSPVGPGAGGQPSSGGSGGAVSEESRDAGKLPCKNSKPLTGESATGQTGGFEVCDDGVVHRPSVSACWSAIGAADAATPPLPGAPNVVTRECSSNGDCIASPHGYCDELVPERLGGAGGTPMQSCHYGCITNDECGAGSVCLCGDPVGTCVKASCTTDADCSGGLLCQKVQIVPSCGDVSYEMRCGPACTEDSDCGDPSVNFGTPTCKNGTCFPGSYCV